MKLIGSRTEKEHREQLIESRESIFNSKDGSHILSAIKIVYPEVKSAFVIHWIPEQVTDEYIVMVDIDKMLLIEFDRRDDEKMPNLEVLDFEKYAQGSRQHLIKMAIAKELALEAMSE
jgi:hypothetical protein